MNKIKTVRERLLTKQGIESVRSYIRGDIDQHALARYCDCSPKTISKILNGKYPYVVREQVVDYRDALYADIQAFWDSHPDYSVARLARCYPEKNITRNMLTRAIYQVGKITRPQAGETTS